MNMQSHSVHEPDEELLSAEDAIQDAERLRMHYRSRSRTDEGVALKVPLSVLLDAIDHLEPSALRKVMQRASDRLASVTEGV